MKDFIKYTFATICGIMLTSVLLLVLGISVLAAIVASSESKVTLEPHSVYCLDMSGTVVDYANTDELTSVVNTVTGMEDAVYGLNDILDNIHKAAMDSRIDGIYLKGGSLGMGVATAQQIRDALEAFKLSGKFVVAYADDYGQLNYYVASVADRVMINPAGSLAWNGLSAEVSFYTRLLKHLGVEMQVVKVGTYKSAVEPFVRTSMSEENRYQTKVYVSDIWRSIKGDVSRSRNISVAKLDALADSYMAMMPQREYVRSGLVDTLCYVQDVEQVLTAYTGTEDYHLVKHADLCDVAATDARYSDNIIAVVYAQGDIVDESVDWGGSELIVGDEYVKLFGELASNDDVKAVVLRVNSGGGSAYASEQMNHAIEMLKQHKPVVVTMGDYAASGGYYMSCNANYIYAEPTTLTGSIGIFGLIPDYGKLAHRVGVDYDGVQTNLHSDLESHIVQEGMNKEEQAILQAEINRGYDLFVNRCAQGRGISVNSIRAIAEGRVWTGASARQLRLVDELGGMQEAVLKAAELAELGDDYMTCNYPEPTDWMTALLGDVKDYGDNRVAAKMEQTIGREAYRSYKYFSSFSRKGCTIHARVPYIIDIY